MKVGLNLNYSSSRINVNTNAKQQFFATKPMQSDSFEKSNQISFGDVEYPFMQFSATEQKHIENAQEIISKLEKDAFDVYAQASKINPNNQWTIFLDKSKGKQTHKERYSYFENGPLREFGSKKS